MCQGRLERRATGSQRGRASGFSVGVAATDTAQRPARQLCLAHPRFSSNPPPLSPPIATILPLRHRRPSTNPKTVAPRRRCHEAVIPPRAADHPGLNSRFSSVRSRFSRIPCSIKKELFFLPRQFFPRKLYLNFSFLSFFESNFDAIEYLLFNNAAIIIIEIHSFEKFIVNTD